MRIALFEPEIAGNVGAVLRLGACFGVAVDLVEPLGFAWDDRRHAGFDEFRASIAPRRLILLTTKSRQSAYDFRFTADDVLLLGKESAGVPDAIAAACDARICIPMQPQVRSMNLATTAALAIGEALRQTGKLPG